MEQVREKRPKVKERHSREREAPPIPPRNVVVGGVRLPDVPTHHPSRIRTTSPEPEEHTISEEEKEDAVEEEKVVENEDKVIPSTSTVEPVIVPIREAPPIPRVKSMEPPEPVVRPVFPRSISLVNTPVRERVQYPALPELAELPSYHVAVNQPPPYTMAPLAHSVSASALPEKSRIGFRTSEAPPLYPDVSSLLDERNEHGLLTESSLLHYYHNHLYETIDDFVNQFVQTEEVPTAPGPLFGLLKRFKELSDHRGVSEVRNVENTEELKKILKECWTQSTMYADGKGTCNENREATGRGAYQSAILQQPNLDKMKKLLSENRNNMMDRILCEETIFRSISLQIQWEVININSNFIMEQQLNWKSPPSLVESSAPTPARVILKKALSDLFYHLRFPRLQKSYVNAVVGWIQELVCVLNMRQSSEDGTFLMCHILRIPSPVTEWAPPLLHTFIQASSPPKLKLDYSLALLTHIMHPIQARESFLRNVAQSEKEESSWAILSEDNEDADEFSFVTIKEDDLGAILDQFPVAELYSIVYLHTSMTGTDKKTQFLALVAFQLLLMKILDDGLTAYAKPGYKQFCKQIGMALRQSVRELSVYWKNTKAVLNPSEESFLQNEVDRILLLALNYLIHRDSVGLWQYLVDLPYESVSESCRQRCEYALRSPKKMTIHELYDTPICEVQARCKSYGLKARTDALSAQDSVFLVNTLSAIAASSNADSSNLLKELIDVCFMDQSSRESLYKVGGEAIGQLLSAKPLALDQLLAIVDRNLSHVETYAIDILASSRLDNCRLSEPILVILGKWLTSHPPDHGANRLARRVLAGMHWGPNSGGSSLWIDVDVQAICADIVVKAHAVHCQKSNGMIAKSINQVKKMASRVTDAESQFQQFCWDLLVKLKIPTSSGNEKRTAKSDLTAHYLKIIEAYETDVTSYLEKAVPLLSDLANSGCSVACAVLLCRFIARHYSQVEKIGANEGFLTVFDQIIHIDDVSYAQKWFYGPSATLTKIVALIASSIWYFHSRLDSMKDYLRAWVTLLCVRRSNWATDETTYQLLSTIVKITFLNDSKDLFGLTDLLREAYTKRLIEDVNSQSFMSKLIGDSGPNPFAPSEMFKVAPEACFLMIGVESEQFGKFKTHMNDAMAKKEKTTLAEAIKKAKSKTSQDLPLSSHAAFRYATLIAESTSSPLLPLMLQKMVQEIFTIRHGKEFNYHLCLSHKIIAGFPEDKMTNVQKALLEVEDPRGLCRAVAGWLQYRKEITKTGFNFSQFDLDYLLQLVLAGDESAWMDFVDLTALGRTDFGDKNLYAATCHLLPKSPSSPSSPRQTSPRSARSTARPMPVLPSHTNIPPVPNFAPELLFQQHAAMQMISPLVKKINELASTFTTGGDKLEEYDLAYCTNVGRLYQPTDQTIPVALACSRCHSPRNVVVAVKAMVFNAETDAKMSLNRESRVGFYNEMTTRIVPEASITAASLEYLARLISRLASGSTAAHRNAAQLTGRSVFYLLTSSIGDNELLFFVASDTYNHALRALGEEFVRFRPEEQMEVMRLVLDGFVLSDALVESFTPEVLNSQDLCSTYQRLSESLRMPEKSERALKLLGRLGMEQAAAGLPPHQFQHLLPIAFANLASQPDTNSQLHLLCLQHVVFFVFHRFPANIVAGLGLALDGCNTGSTPESLFETFADKLGAGNFTALKRENDLGGVKAIECSTIMAQKLEAARKRVPSLYSIWGRYINSLTRLAQLFLYTPIRDGFEPNLPVSVLQRDLYENFDRITAIFSPLIAPQTASQPPFFASNEAEASIVLQRFIELINSLPHNAAIPPGMQNVQSLIWQFYYEKLSILNVGQEFYFNLLERYLVALNWQHLWPSLRGLAAMDDCLASRSAACASFVSQMIVRVPWLNVLATQIQEDDRPIYLSVLLSTMVRLVCRAENYTNVRASLLGLLKNLSQRGGEWSRVHAEHAEKVAEVVENCLPSDSARNNPDIVNVVHSIWRKTCNFQPREPSNRLTLDKQTIWLRTECSLVLKLPSTVVKSAYNSLISDVIAVASSQQNLQEFCPVAKELTAAWKNVSDPKIGELLICQWEDFMKAKPDNPLVLTSLNTLLGSLNRDQLSMGLRVMENTLEAYFNRGDSNWSDLLHWIRFPEENMKEIRAYLMTVPTSENKIQSRLLTLAVFLDFPAERDATFKELLQYVTALKPKHITNEPALLAVIARLVNWIAKKTSTETPSEDLITPLIRWLSKSAKDDSNILTNWISSKKTSHSQQLRILMNILELYLTQQSLGEGKRPRSSPNSPVMNSRITTLKDLASQKSSQPFSSAFNTSTTFFVDVESHNILSASRLVLATSRTVFNKKYLNDV